jgi:3-(3-hydroxy-phenyl)propionate hydroxylase
LRDRALLDPGDRLFARLGVPADSVVLVRPDEHIAAIVPMAAGAAVRAYAGVTGMTPP